MKKLCLILSFCLLTCGMLQLQAQDQQHSSDEINKLIRGFEKSHPGLMKVETLCQSANGHDILAVTLGKGETGMKPAVALVAGIEGKDVNSSELALLFLEKMLADKSAAEELLNEITFYLIPQMNPDAREQFFAGLSWERTGNGKAWDTDRDGAVDEDPFEDLNGDGMITMMRVADPAGEYLPHPDDNRLMVKADASKGQTGSWLYLTEGIDNDKDGFFNEDGPGGVCMNRNHSYAYEEFGPEAGVHAASATETRKVLDFLYEKSNIYAVFSIQPEDNLLKPLKHNPAKARSRKVETILPEDEKMNQWVSEQYNEMLEPNAYTVSAAANGNFRDWAYYHFGRYAYAAPACHIAMERGTSLEQALLKAGEEAGQEVFVNWQKVEHPDFAGKTVEVGGIKPFANERLGAEKLDEVAEKYTNFMRAMAEGHPELTLVNMETTDLGNGVYRVKVDLLNKGLFGTSAKVGEPNKFVRRLRLELIPANGQEIISGTPIQFVTRLEGDQHESFSWLIRGKGEIEIKAGAPAGGFDQLKIRLK